MIKLAIFDLDGVLYDSKEYHFNALNNALAEVDEKYVISYKDHLAIFDGMPTNKKLEVLKETKGLNSKYFKQIWTNKQINTNTYLDTIEKNHELISNLKGLKKSNIKLVCASNSIESTVKKVLSKLGIIELFDMILSNEDVKNPKPHPEMYWKPMIEFGISPENTLVIEDSPIGRLGARLSSANTLFVEESKDLNSSLFSKMINNDFANIHNELNTYTNNKLNVLIPMAGRGSRFQERGYVFPKPLIEIKGKPMIQVVLENLNIDANYIFIVQKEHNENFNINQMLKIQKPNSIIYELDEVTEGAASTTLIAKESINNKAPLLICNSDQFIEWNPREVMYQFVNADVDGGILTFESTHPKWSYAKLGDDGFVSEVAEKNPISTNATVGVYYWKHGQDYVKYAEEMIEENIRVNNEFYVCPVYNQAIKDKKNIKIKEIEKMWGLGTPEDLETFLQFNDNF